LAENAPSEATAYELLARGRGRLPLALFQTFIALPQDVLLSLVVVFFEERRTDEGPAT